MISAADYAVARYPGVDSTRVSSLVPLAEATIRATERYGDQYGIACGLLVLHWITLEEQAAANSSETGNAGTVTGSVTSEKEGNLSISYGDKGATSGTPGGSAMAAWDTTSWGRELIQLTKAACFGAGTA